jgi:uncharacterized membrane protein YhaH (DUF805 family)
MGFVEAVKSFYGRYTDFSTRSSRSEYWWVVLFSLIASIVLMIPAFGSFAGMDIEAIEAGDLSTFSFGPFIPLILFGLVSIIPGIALAVRRLHDFEKSGWFYLLYVILAAIPVIGLIVSLGWIIIMCLRGTAGDNRFGPDPLSGGY